MQDLLVRLRLAGRFSRAELAAVGACALSFSVWNAAARGFLALEVIPVFALLGLACVLAGRLCARVLGEDVAADVPTVFLLGFLALNSALYMLAWVSPRSIIENALGLLGLVVVATVWRPSPALPDPGASRGAAALALALSLIAATFWSRDAITPEVVFRDGVLVKPWIDSQFHTCEIRMFREARGFATLADLRMAGEPVWIYHHASYVAPALVSAATGASAYQAYGSFLVPVGVLLTGLAAYALARSLWGAEAGVAAAAALLLLPDATRHGLDNPCLGYHWLQQIAPAGFYGVAVLAAAWLLMFAACREGRLGLVGLSFLTAGLAAHFKSHLFVASALLLWLYPGVFFRGVRWERKGVWLTIGLVSFVMIAGAAQGFQPVPTMRLDGSGIKPYMNRTVALLRYASARDYFARFTPDSSLASDVYWGSILLFYGTLGLFGLANLAVLGVVLAGRLLKRPARLELEYAAFPVLVGVNYLVMGLGLARDQNNPGHPEELLHRPLVWAYFIAAALTGATLYRLLLDGPARRIPWLRPALAAAALGLLVLPYRMGPQVQVGPTWGQLLCFRSYPRGWFECARYIRENARADDVVQESRNDPIFVFSAACERPAYAIAYFDGRADQVLSARLAELETFKTLDDAESIRRFAGTRRIRWYVLDPDTRVRWPASLLARPAFTWNDFRVFSFPPLAAAATIGGR
jgi:hypothetical protein